MKKLILVLTLLLLALPLASAVDSVVRQDYYNDSLYAITESIETSGTEYGLDGDVITNNLSTANAGWTNDGQGDCKYTNSFSYTGSTSINCTRSGTEIRFARDMPNNATFNGSCSSRIYIASGYGATVATGFQVWNNAETRFDLYWRPDFVATNWACDSGACTTPVAVQFNTWQNITFNWTSANIQVWIGNTLTHTASGAGISKIAGITNVADATVYFDDFVCYNGDSRPQTATTPDTTPPSITKYSSQGSSCTNWNTNPSNPCSTSDTTPTLYFNTSESSFCAIATSSLNYTQIGSSRNCTSGEGTIEHACTLISEDELVYDNSIIYLSCKDSSGNMNMSGKSTSGPLSITITGLEIAGRNAIGLGIQNALLSGYTNYTDLQIYARNLSNFQTKGTFDRAAKKGNKMWAFNRIGVSDSYTNMINLTPVLYVMEFANMTSTNLTNMTQALIEATR